MTTVLPGCRIVALVFEGSLLAGLIFFVNVGPALGSPRLRWEISGQGQRIPLGSSCVTSVCSGVPLPPAEWSFTLEGKGKGDALGGTWCLHLSLVPGPSFLLPSGHVVNLLEVREGLLESGAGEKLILSPDNYGNQSARSYFDLVEGDFWLVLPVLISAPIEVGRCTLIVRGWSESERIVWTSFELTNRRGMKTCITYLGSR